jgi:hypothetical protein
MSAIAKFRPDDSLEGSRTCQILILCEDFAAYEQAKDVCWRIVVQLADDLDFSFNCWNFYELTEPACMDSVIRSSAASDVILLSLQNARLPALAEAWLDNVTRIRRKPEGVLALVLNEPADSAEAVRKLIARLEHSARRLGMDFLSPTFTHKASSPQREHRQNFKHAAAR